MARFGKWIGGSLGWAFGGPIGALFGFAIGSMYDNADVAYKQGSKYQRSATSAGDFSMSLLALSAVVMKADGKLKRSELNYIKTFFQKQFGPEYTKRQMLLLRDLLEKEIPVQDICEQIKFNMDMALRLQLMHYLFGIARADGNVDRSEVNVLKDIAQKMGISANDFASLQAMFYKDTDGAYKILEVEKSATDAEVKKAYRKMAVKYHPDKVAHLGEEFRHGAEEKFKKVQEAYDQIKKERGIK